MTAEATQPAAERPKSKVAKVPVRAFVVRDRTGAEEGCEIVFARTVREARAHGYIDNVPYIDRAAKHEPAFDKFAPGPVPVAAMLAEGWWFPCASCDRTLREDPDAGYVVRESSLYCDEKCAAKDDGWRAGYEFSRREAAAAQREAEQKFPDAAVVHCGMLARGYLGSPYDPALGACIARYEPWPAEGSRIHVRLHFRAIDAYASWSPGDAAHTELEFYRPRHGEAGEASP